MRVDDRHVARLDTGLSQQTMVDLKDDFLPDPQFRMVNQDVGSLGDRTLKAVLDRDHSCVSGSVFHRAHGRGDGPEGYEDGPFGLERGLFAVGPRWTQVCQLPANALSDMRCDRMPIEASADRSRTTEQRLRFPSGPRKGHRLRSWRRSLCSTSPS